jgi:hypothetical protein
VEELISAVERGRLFLGLVDHRRQVIEHELDEAAQENDVAAGAERSVDVRHGRGACEPRVDMDKRGGIAATRLGLHHPLERHWMALGHVRPHDHETVGMFHVHGERGRAAAAEGSAQTGHGRAVSYPRLVFEVDHAKCPHELALDVVPFVVHRLAIRQQFRLPDLPYSPYSGLHTKASG